MNSIKWVGQHIEVEPPKRPKKITGTRLAAILGLNRWNTPFKTWCEITKTYQEPFEDTVYTLAGKIIEPKQAEYMRTAYAMAGLVKPADIWGEDYFNKTYGDFFPENRHLGGMWDYLVNDACGKTQMVLEMKTTQRAEDWKNDIPEYYAIQAALYAYLKNVDSVVMVCTLLSPKDYERLEDFEVNVTNTFVRPFRVSERYPDFASLIERAEKWWADHVDTGISPDFDEKADADVLNALRTTTVNPDADLSALIREGEEIQAELDRVSESVDKRKKRLEAIKKQIRELMCSNIREGENRAEIMGASYVWSVSRSVSTKVDEEKLKADGLYEKYSRTEPAYRMTVSKKKEEK